MKRSLGAKPLACPTPVYVVGSYDERGRPNAMTAAWTGICCSKPPSMAVSLRRATYTHGNIERRRAFTIGVPSIDQLVEVDYLGIASGKDEDKIAATGLTAMRSELIDAPCFDELPLTIECALSRTIEIGLHTQFIGEIRDVKADEAILGEGGLPDLALLRPFVFAPGSRVYHAVGERAGKAFSAGKTLRST